LNSIATGAKVESADIRRWFKAVDNVKALATSFGDEDTLGELDKQIQKMNWVYKALTGENSPLMMKGEFLNVAWRLGRRGADIA
jgi:hypothetical protein